MFSDTADSDLKLENGAFNLPVEGEIRIKYGTEILYNGIPPQECYQDINFKVEEKTSVTYVEDEIPVPVD